MKITILALLFLSIVSGAAPALAQNCQHDSDTASDGSRCGGRSADSRAGGN